MGELRNRKKINFNLHEDHRGNLFALNATQIPFNIKRVFTVYNVPNGETRGYHAHHKTTQFLVCLSGRLEIKLIDLSGYELNVILDPGTAIREFQYEWAEITFFENAILQTICSTEHDENDYIRDIDEFKRIGNVQSINDVI